MKKITKFDFNTSNISDKGEVRKFRVIAEQNAVFSLEIVNEDNHYYNFSTKTFAAKESKLNQKVITGGFYEGYVHFPLVTDSDHYQVRVWAGENYNTRHADYTEVRRLDGSLDINASSGSNSNLLEKKIFQYVNVDITINNATSYSSTDWGSITTSSRVITDGLLSEKRQKHSFSITASVAGNKGISIVRQPTPADIFSVSARQYGTPVEIGGEDPFTYSRPLTTTVNGPTSSSNTIIFDTTNTVLGLVVGDAISVTDTSGVLHNDSDVLITHLNPAGDNTSEIQISEALSIADEAVVTFYYKGYYRWNIHADSSLHGITSGMIINGTNGIDPFLTLASYHEDQRIERTVEIEYTEEEKARFEKDRGLDIEQLIKEQEIIIREQERESGIRIDPKQYEELQILFKEQKERLPQFTVEVKVKEINYPAVEQSAASLTYANGVISKQLGVITHNNQQAVGVQNQAFNVFAYGQTQINSLTHCNAVFSNLKAELTEVTTTTAGAISNANLLVSDRSGFINNVTRVKAIGISAASGSPLITSGAGSDGQGTVVMDSSQVIENGQIVTLLGSGSVVTITGDIDISRFPALDTTLSFDVSRFLLTN